MAPNQPPVYKWAVAVGNSPAFDVKASYPDADEGRMLLKDADGAVVFAAAHGVPCTFSRGDRVEAADGPVLRLPPHMAGEHGHWIAMIGTGWHEVLPGLQASLTTFNWALRDPEVNVQFRCTPEGDAQQHD